MSQSLSYFSSYADLKFNIKMDLVETGWGCVDSIGLAQDRDKWRALVNAAMQPRAT
jgi:hypothetical protein